ncbi:hypothetical protein EDB86DRAFT_3108371 [Lactarius hatsudake]|nr:hypothetical protein EDB86DRAFT_3108371 [Lactarius hatsudake]
MSSDLRIISPLLAFLSPCPSGLPSHVPANLAPSPSTSNSKLCLPASSESTPASLSQPLELDDVKLPGGVVFVVARRTRSLPSHITTSPEAPPNAPISPHSTPPTATTSRTQGDRLNFRPLEVTPTLTLVTLPATHLTLQQPLLVYEVSLTLAAPHFSHPAIPRIQSGFSFARLTLALSFVTIAALVLLLNVFKTFSITRKFCSKNEDFGNGQIDTFESSKSSNTFVHRLRLGQLTPRVFKFKRSSFNYSAHEDVHKRKSTTRISRTLSPSPFPF